MNANVARAILVPLLTVGALVLSTFVVYANCGAALI
jgi:hypothetical protein